MHGLLYTHGELDLRYSEGLAPSVAYANGNYVWEYMDKRGETVIRLPSEIEFARLHRFSGGIAKVSFSLKEDPYKKEKQGYINKNGQFIWRSP